jgi:hypothetical protein
MAAGRRKSAAMRQMFGEGADGGTAVLVER